MQSRSSSARRPWSRLEVEATVADYLRMLTLELAGQKYNKSAHRRALLANLSGRTEQSVELKHQNISAILIELGAPWIVGYKPMSNYQQLLYEIVESQIDHDHDFDAAASAAIELPANAPVLPDYANLLVQAPSRSVVAEEARKYVRRLRGVRKDYLALEGRNRSLGKAGEEFVTTYERHRLHSAGVRMLADRVEHVAVTRGDGLGYDVLSFESNGKEKLIEVKTTAFGRETPFYVSRTELELSKAESDNFYLYRLFEFRLDPRMFLLSGGIGSHCLLDPASYLARFS